MRTILVSVFLVLAVAPVVKAADTLSASTALNDYSGSVAATVTPIDSSGLAYDFANVMDVGQREANSLSAVVTYSTGVFSAVSFTTASYTLNNSTISATSHGYTAGLPLLYDAGASAAISGLTDETTYYAIPITSSLFALAATSTAAVADVRIVLASSVTTANQSYTLTPLEPTGTISFTWTVSNDGTNYAAFETAVSSSVAAYNGGPKVFAKNFSEMNYRYLKLSVVAPTAGGLKLKAAYHVKMK